VYANSPNVFTKQTALDLVSTNLDILLGLSDDKAKVQDGASAWVAWEGEVFGMQGRVRGVKSAGAEAVDLF
jgi:hypothetical protein